MTLCAVIPVFRGAATVAGVVEELVLDGREVLTRRGHLETGEGGLVDDLTQ